MNEDKIDTISEMFYKDIKRGEPILLQCSEELYFLLKLDGLINENNNT